MDQEAIQMYRNSYDFSDNFHKQATKHINKKCNCKKTNKICNVNGAVIDLSKLSDKEYINNNIEFIKTIYNIVMSVSQSSKSKAGKTLEDIVEHFFIKENVSYKKQQAIMMDKKTHIVDFIVNDNEIISCKTNLRERILQDKFLGKFTLISFEKYEGDTSIKSVQIKDGEFEKYVKSLKKLQ